MSFGFSVGDFIAIIELAKKIRKEFADAPSQFKDISDELRGLSIVLQDVEVIPGLNTQQKAELKEIINNCLEVLKKLEATLDIYKELKSGNSGKSLKRVWQRVTWDPVDMKDLRSRIVSNVTLLNTFQAKITSQISSDIKAGVGRLHERQDSRERQYEEQAILDWITPMDYGSQQNDFISRRQEGTGNWLLDSKEFNSWIKDNKQTLFCPGIPGAGKTILTSIVVDELITRFRHDESIGIAYLYCNFRQKNEQKIGSLLLSLLKQLATRQPSLQSSVKDLYSRHKNMRTRPSVDEISQCLQSVIHSYSRVFIVVDALDECQEVSESTRTKLLSEIFNLQTIYGANIFATSRFIPEVTANFEQSFTKILEIRATGEDVRKYLDGHMFRLPGFVVRSPELQEEVKSKIVELVQGMFLLVQFHLGSLIGKKSLKAFRKALATLATGSEAYEQAYKDAMERIEGQVKDQEELAKQVLSWITCAKRPLNILELQHALAVEFKDLHFDEDNIPEIEDMVSVCAGLVTVDKESGIIRLIHYTTQEYFERTWKRWFPDAENNILVTCLTYLSFDNFKSGYCQSENDFKERLRLYPLYKYASDYWGYHYLSDSTMIPEVISFLRGNSHVEASVQTLLSVKLGSEDSGYRERLPKQMTGLHLTAYLGLENLVKLLLDMGHNLGTVDSYEWTPMHWASQRGHIEVVKVLLDKGADAMAPDFKGRTPLHVASTNGHAEVVKCLIKYGVDTVAADYKDLTPLFWACHFGHIEVVKLLLDENSSAIIADAEGWTPLHWACEDSEHSHAEVVKLLLDKVSNPNVVNNYGWTPLHLASKNGSIEIVKVLLDNGAMVEIVDRKGYTALYWACHYGHVEVVKLLLEKGNNIVLVKKVGWTPLHWACEGGHIEVVKLLLSKSFDPNVTANNGWTPLHSARKRGFVEVVKVLLNNGARDEWLIRATTQH